MKTIFYTFLLISFTFSLSAQTWVQRASLPGAARTASAGCSFQGKGYVMFGYTTPNSNFNNVYEYDPILNTWTQKNNSPGSPRRGAFLLSNDSIVFTGLGTNGSITYKDFYQYFPQSDSWASKANYPGTGGHLGLAAIVGNYIYVGGGQNRQNRQHSGDFWRYDISADSWTDSITQFPFGPRTGGITFAIDSLIYFGLGHNGFSSFKDLWKYNITLNQWSRLADFPGIDRLNANVFISSGKVIVGGGYRLSGSAFGDYYQYDPISDSWSTAPTFSGGNRSISAEFVIDNLGYIVGGWDSSQNSISDVWSFKPLITSEKENIASNYSWEIYPNPANNNFILNLEKDTEGIYTVYSITGKIMVRKNFNAAVSQIDCSKLAEGTYLVQVISNGTSSTKKLIINR